MAWRGGVLLVGDLAALTAFSLIGRGSHGLTLSTADVARTGLPFAAAWLAVNLVTGGFRNRTHAPAPGTAALEVVQRYLAAGPLALVGRSFWLDRPVVASFAAVALSTSLALLVIWRAAYAWWCAHRRPDAVR
ncbi:MAG TPA: DUF3054 domain-containing protein [Bacillota bacterium]